MILGYEHESSVFGRGQFFRKYRVSLARFLPSGAPDVSFGASGRGVIQPCRDSGVPLALSILPSGGFVAAVGGCQIGLSTGVYVVRYAAGDDPFGPGSYSELLSKTNGYRVGARRIAVLKDVFVFASYTNDELLLNRYKTTGAFTVTRCFGRGFPCFNDPLPSFSATTGVKAKALQIWPLRNGEVLVDAVVPTDAASGNSGEGQRVLFRFAVTGETVTSFGVNGAALPLEATPATVSGAVNSVNINDAAEQSDGRIVISDTVCRLATATTAVSCYGRLYRLLANGQIDRGFADGKVFINIGNAVEFLENRTLQIRAQDDDRILVTRRMDDGRWVLERLTPDGVTELGFGVKQRAQGLPGIPTSIAVDREHGIFVTGTRNASEGGLVGTQPYVSKLLNDRETASLVKVIEYYAPSLDHYFLTASATEAAVLDQPGTGWQRTGYTFTATRAGATQEGDSEGGPPVVPVCRFYGDRATGGPNSHFFTADRDECDLLREQRSRSRPNWLFEQIAFAVAPADENGNCLSRRVPVTRWYNKGFPQRDPNHRYTVTPEAEAAMIAKGWLREKVAFCVPR